MTVDTIIYNTKLCIHGNLVEAGLAIDDGKIFKIAKETNLPSASKKIKLNGHITLPGVIDAHVHLRDQQLAYKEDFFTGTSAAAAGGVTSVIDMPNNSPVTMNSSSLKERMKLAEKRILVNVAFNSAFPPNVKEIAEVAKAGAVGFKLYLADKIGGIDVEDDELLCKAFREVGHWGLTVSVHAEDGKMVEERKREMEVLNRNDADAFLFVHSPEAEAEAVKRVTGFVKESGCHVHFCHISSALGLDAVMVAKQDGLPVTCEVTPHNLFLSSEQYRSIGNLGLTVPPIRSEKNASVLWNGLKHGFVDVLASDHAPHTIAEKKAVSVWDAKLGVPGLETMLPLLLTQVNKGCLSFAELVRVTAEEPAKIFCLKNRGVLEEGAWADFVVVDMKGEYRVDSSGFFSKAKYSPFDGMWVKGKPVKTFVSGELVLDEGVIVAEFGSGHVVCG